MVTHLVQLITNLYMHATPFCEFLHQDASFVLIATCTNTFAKVKALLCHKMTVLYFGTLKPIINQVDISTDGLVATLLQEGRLVAFTTNTLIPIVQWYSKVQQPCVWMQVHHGIRS